MLMLWMFGAGLVLMLGMVFFMLIKYQARAETDELVVDQLDRKVVALESNLQKSLHIMQDLAKKMHRQQQVIDQNKLKLGQLETQNAELVNVLAKAIQSKSS